jgi:hypothetical protein
MRAVLEVCRHGTDAQGVPNQVQKREEGVGKKSSERSRRLSHIFYRFPDDTFLLLHELFERIIT